MSGARYLIAGAMLALGAGYISNEVIAHRQAPLAMLRRVAATITCVENQMRYENLRFSCGTPLTFSDFRKLDMRADNRARSLRGGARSVAARP
jgi:UDP:flavonoid glycosyltransferase YjiC (YdhE family)